MIKKLFLILFSLFLTACDAKNSCDQKEIVNHFLSTFKNSLKYANWELIWDLYLDKEVKISVSEINELGVSKDERIRSCSANFKFELPTLNEKIEVFEGDFKGILDGLPKYFIGMFVRSFKPEQISNINDKNQIFESRIYYTVTNFEKYNTEEDVELEFDSEKTPALKILVFKVAQIIGNEIIRKQPKEQKEIVWNKDKFSYLIQKINENKSLSKNEKYISICTLTTLSKKTYLSSYASYATLSRFKEGNLQVQKEASVDPNFSEFTYLVLEAATACHAPDLLRQKELKDLRKRLDKLKEFRRQESEAAKNQ